MKVLVIPDIHLKPWIFDRAAEILREGKAEGAVCLMDIPDDWGMELSVDQYRDTFDRAISFAEAQTETSWCYGNNDVSYPWGKLETGYSPYAEATAAKVGIRADAIEKDVAFKQKFYYSKGAHYETATLANVQLIPREDIMADVKADYKAMENMIYGTVSSFDAIIEYLHELEKEIHSLA